MERSRKSVFYSPSNMVTSEFDPEDDQLPRTEDGNAIVSVQYIPTIYSSLSTTRVRQRLSDLMGTDVIRLNDKRYFQKLTERLHDEYETTMDKQEEARMASEEQRLRRLMLEGVIDAPDDYRAVVFGNKPKQNKKKKRRKSRKHAHGFTADDSKASDDEGHSKSRKDEVVTQVEILNGSRPTSSKSSISTRSDATSTHGKKKVSIQERENETHGQTYEMHVRPPHHESALRSSSACSTHRKQRRIKSAAPKISHWSKEESSDEESDYNQRHYDTQSLPDKDYFKKGSRYSKYSLQEPERVCKLRNEETVAGLYSIAEELVSPLKANDEPQRKGKKPF
ncbi:hypothetical protein ACF0H5_021556 [Mactra antiquata]